MKRVVCFCFLLWVILPVKAQDTAFYFSSRIVDAESGVPVSYAVVESTESFRKVFTNANGDFTILVKKKGEILRVSADNYSDAYFSFPMVLHPANTLAIEPIGLYEGKKNEAYWQSVFRDGRWIVLDFAFFYDAIFILAKHKSSPFNALVVMDTSGNQISQRSSSEYFLGFHSIAGFGNFLLGSTSAFPIVSTPNPRVLWDSAIPIRKFENLYYSRPYNDSSGSYVCYDSQADFFLNEEAELMARKKYSTCYIRLRKNNRLSLFKNFSDESFLKSPGKWKRTTELQMPDLPHSNGSVLYSGSPFTFFSVNDKLVLADDHAFRLEVFDSEGKFSHGFDYYKGKEKLLFQKLLIDKVSNRFYFVAAKDFGVDVNPEFSLQQINPISGRLTHLYMNFSSSMCSLRVHNGFAYYIFSDAGSRFLVRSKL